MKDQINPSHYKGHLRIPRDRVQELIDPETGDITLEWIDKMEFQLTSEEFRGLLKGQSDKYMSRLGQKDEEAQEVQKAGWYLQRLVKFFQLTKKQE